MASVPGIAVADLGGLGRTHPAGRAYAPPVRMIKLKEARSITPYKWVHPDEER
jgi:hypothetical protein